MPNAVDTGIMRGRMLANRTTKNVAGAAGVNITLDDLRYGVIELIGAITANIAVIFPAIDGLFVEVFNNTTGAFVITAKMGSSRSRGSANFSTWTAARSTTPRAGRAPRSDRASL